MIECEQAGFGLTSFNDMELVESALYQCFLLSVIIADTKYSYYGIAAKYALSHLTFSNDGGL